jgi:hypothetical protein
MGFFSWKTNNTGESIPNMYSGLNPFPVVMQDDKGNFWSEDCYEGYGVFGGKDYYELLAEMNGFVECEDSPKDLRSIGIDLAHLPHTDWHERIAKHMGDRTRSDVKHPQLHRATQSFGKWQNVAPEICEHQGYFYE